ncbi:hypothetical protein VTI74DRAFT_1134 [Chaetomium olivicolor]
MLLRLPALLALTTLIPLILALPSPKQPWYERYHHPIVRVPQSYYEALQLRRQTPLNPHAARDIACADRNSHILFHDEHAATLAICGGLAGGTAASATTTCDGSAGETEGRSGTALFTLRAVESGAGVKISKEEWVACVRAAREACPRGSVEGVCVGGATRGDVRFSLRAVAV